MNPKKLDPFFTYGHVLEHQRMHAQELAAPCDVQAGIQLKSLVVGVPDMLVWRCLKHNTNWLAPAWTAECPVYQDLQMRETL